MHTIPSIGLGTYQIPNNTVTDLVLQALDVGYRHIDTAQRYENEAGIGKALATTTTPREQIRLTTKVRINNYTPERCRTSIEQSLRDLQTDYIDLVLLHRPNTRVGHRYALDCLLQLKQEGKINQLGVSNFPIALLAEAIQHTEKQIYTNQIEYHVLFDPVKIRTYCQDHNIIVSAYSPFAHGAIFGNNALETIAKKHHTTVAQVALQRLIGQPGVVALPKASSRERLTENLDACSLELNDTDKATLDALPKNQRRCNPTFHPLRDD